MTKQTNETKQDRLMKTDYKFDGLAEETKGKKTDQDLL